MISLVVIMTMFLSPFTNSFSFPSPTFSPQRGRYGRKIAQSTKPCGCATWSSVKQKQKPVSTSHHSTNTFLRESLSPSEDSESAMSAQSRSTNVITRTANMNGDGGSFIENLANRFQGDFDNYNQVLQERERGILPGEGGGHEHFHVTLMPVTNSLLKQHYFETTTTTASKDDEASSSRGILAAYYFDGMPQKLFRFRLYVMQEEKGDDDTDVIRMKIYNLAQTNAMATLRTMIDQPIDWEHTILKQVPPHDEPSQQQAQHKLFEELDGCDVIWTQSPNRTRHTYLFHSNDGDDDEITSTQYKNGVHIPPPSEPNEAFHAILVNENAVLDSMMAPGTKIRVQDELSLWSNDLWINDRGYDVVSNKMLYGNRLGIPYKVQRVANFCKDHKSQQKEEEERYTSRKVVDNTLLAWTLGETWRTLDEYKHSMDALLVPENAGTTR